MMKEYNVNFKRTSWGFIRILAENEEEAKEKLDNGEWYDEFDNKSEYEFEDEICEDGGKEL